MANTGYIEFEIADAAVSLVDPVAWVTCTERITSAGAGGAPAAAEVAATNLFVLDGSGWRIALHHASPVIRPAPAEA
jgi:ketosteroid isomerase-like protein